MFNLTERNYAFIVVGLIVAAIQYKYGTTSSLPYAYGASAFLIIFGFFLDTLSNIISYTFLGISALSMFVTVVKFLELYNFGVPYYLLLIVAFGFGVSGFVLRGMSSQPVTKGYTKVKCSSCGWKGSQKRFRKSNGCPTCGSDLHKIIG